MTWANPGPAPSQKFLSSQSVAADAITVTIPAGEGTSTLGVIDSILWCGQSSGAGALTLSVNGAIVARKQLAALNQAEYGLITFSGGWPQWSASGTDTAVVGANAIVLSGPATLSNASLTVCFHYIDPGVLRN